MVVKLYVCVSVIHLYCGGDRNIVKDNSISDQSVSVYGVGNVT